MAEDIRWWIHRFESSGVRYFKVDHQAKHTNESGYETSQPEKGPGFDDIAFAEAILASWKPSSGDSNWYIHRTGAAFAPARWYEINHQSNSPGAYHCGPYANLTHIQTHENLSVLDIIGECGEKMIDVPSCIYDALRPPESSE